MENGWGYLEQGVDEGWYGGANLGLAESETADFTRVMSINEKAGFCSEEERKSGVPRSHSLSHEKRICQSKIQDNPGHKEEER